VRTGKIILPGGAGLVGQNLVIRLKALGFLNLVVIDKHRQNLATLAAMHPDITTECADLAEAGSWTRHFDDADVVVMLQAQIGGNDYRDFKRNNLDASRNILNCIKKRPSTYLVHISSSVVESVADDFYTNSKKDQEQMVLESGIECPILRPTLMFGWFDRKHLGWLARFMQKVPVFPIPGKGNYMRQPLYVGDFCNVVVSCIESRKASGIFNISGHEQIDYIDIIRQIKVATASRTPIVRIPYSIFYALIWVWGKFDSTPPFTTQQLKALIAEDEFEVIDWPGMFGVPLTPFSKAVAETFNDPRYGKVTLEF